MFFGALSATVDEETRLGGTIGNGFPEGTLGKGNPEPRPSGPPSATQRRTISVVGEQNGKDCDRAARASGGLMAGRERCTGSLSPWSARYDIVREGAQRRQASGAHCQTRHIPVGGCLARARSAVPAAASDADSGAGGDTLTAPPNRRLESHLWRHEE